MSEQLWSDERVDAEILIAADYGSVSLPHMVRRMRDEYEVELARLRTELATANERIAYLERTDTEQVDEFNAGYEAGERGLTPDEPPGMKHDEWRVGYAFAMYPVLTESVTVLESDLADAGERLAALEAGQDYEPVTDAELSCNCGCEAILQVDTDMISVYSTDGDVFSFVLPDGYRLMRRRLQEVQS